MFVVGFLFIVSKSIFIDMNLLDKKQTFILFLGNVFWSQMGRVSAREALGLGREGGVHMLS